MGQHYNQAEIIQKHQQAMMEHLQQKEYEARENMIRNQHMQMEQQFEAMKLAEELKQEHMEEQHKQVVHNYENEQKNIIKSSGSMLEVMMSDPDPRFQNSKFLHFLKRIQDKEIVIEGKEIK